VTNSVGSTGKEDFLCSLRVSARICEPMPLEPRDLKFYEAACGFLQLGMALDADAELDKIDPFNRAAPEVLALRLEIYRRLKKWELMREIAKRLNEFDPNEVQWLVSYAFATRRAVSLEVARELQSDPLACRSQAKPCFCLTKLMPPAQSSDRSLLLRRPQTFLPVTVFFASPSQHRVRRLPRGSNQLMKFYEC
jgi:hypothetical protein